MSEQGKESVEICNEERKGEKKVKKKVESPAKVSMLMRKKSNSLPIMEAWQKGEKRKERQEEKGMAEGLEEFRKSVMVYRSPVKAMGEEEKGEKGGKGGVSRKRFEEVIKEMRNGFARIQAQMVEVKEIKVQIKKEIEDLKAIWKKEKVGLEKRIDEIEKRIKEKKYGEGKEVEVSGEMCERVLSLEERTRMLELGKERERKE
ncbi:hypothetical protein PUN28_002188 [Cardiocondyla obscurior]|uniref:Uncharacterized protein n=1 Tax=Cardiocondyla obscurior TaxID=286306 RepID=A0AAW2GT27_9HYME